MGIQGITEVLSRSGAFEAPAQLVGPIKRVRPTSNDSATSFGPMSAGAGGFGFPLVSVFVLLLCTATSDGSIKHFRQ